MGFGAVVVVTALAHDLVREPSQPPTGELIVTLAPLAVGCDHGSRDFERRGAGHGGATDIPSSSQPNVPRHSGRAGITTLDRCD